MNLNIANVYGIKQLEDINIQTKAFHYNIVNNYYARGSGTNLLFLCIYLTTFSLIIFTKNVEITFPFRMHLRTKKRRKERPMIPNNTATTTTNVESRQSM